MTTLVKHRSKIHFTLLVLLIISLALYCFLFTESVIDVYKRHSQSFSFSDIENWKFFGGIPIYVALIYFMLKKRRSIYAAQVVIFTRLNYITALFFTIKLVLKPQSNLNNLSPDKIKNYNLFENLNTCENILSFLSLLCAILLYKSFDSNQYQFSFNLKHKVKPHRINSIVMTILVAYILLIFGLSQNLFHTRGVDHMLHQPFFIALLVSNTTVVLLGLVFRNNLAYVALSWLFVGFAFDFMFCLQETYDIFRHFDEFGHAILFSYRIWKLLFIVIPFLFINFQLLRILYFMRSSKGEKLSYSESNLLDD